MPRHLLLVRHAKSAWDDPELADHDRPLAPRGERALPHLRRHLANLPPPDLVLCSTARRTRETFAGIRSALPQDVRVEHEQVLYAASAHTVLGRLHRIDGDVRCVLVVGHNPSLQDLAETLVGSGDPELRSRLSAKFPTAATATLSFDGPWPGLQPGAARLDDFFVPRPPGR